MCSCLCIFLNIKDFRRLPNTLLRTPYEVLCYTLYDLENTSIESLEFVVIKKKIYSHLLQYIYYAFAEILCLYYMTLYYLCTL